MTNRKLFCTTLMAATLLSGAAFANDTADFVKKASLAGLYEIEAGKLAEQRAQSSEVKAFAQKMVAEHTKANAELKAAVAEGKPELALATALDDAHQKKLDKLKAAKDVDFDKEYVNMQEDAHDDAVALFKDYADDGDNAAIKAFAVKTLPVLELHDKHIETLEEVKG